MTSDWERLKFKDHQLWILMRIRRNGDSEIVGESVKWCNHFRKILLPTQ